MTQDVTVTYFLEAGAPVVLTKHLPAGNRVTVDVNADLGPEHDVSTRIDGTAPLYAERPFYFNRPVGGAGAVNGGHDDSGQHN
jgi:hypothetical protein